MGPEGTEGIRLIKMEAFPFMRSSERRDMAWLQTSLSSLPVCLAIACAIFLTSWTAVLCHPPKDSKARGMKDTPCLSHNVPFDYLDKFLISQQTVVKIKLRFIVIGGHSSKIPGKGEMGTPVVGIGVRV